MLRTGNYLVWQATRRIFSESNSHSQTDGTERSRAQIFVPLPCWAEEPQPDGDFSPVSEAILPLSRPKQHWFSWLSLWSSRAIESPIRHFYNKTSFQQNPKKVGLPLSYLNAPSEGHCADKDLHYDISYSAASSFQWRLLHDKMGVPCSSSLLEACSAAAPLP